MQTLRLDDYGGVIISCYRWFFFFSAHFLDTCKQADKEDGTVTWAADIVQE